MKYKSEILETIHENAVANFEIGAISEAKMRQYDKMCLNGLKTTKVKQEHPQKEPSDAPVFAVVP